MTHNDYTPARFAQRVTELLSPDGIEVFSKGWPAVPYFIMETMSTPAVGHVSYSLEGVDIIAPQLLWRLEDEALRIAVLDQLAH